MFGSAPLAAVIRATGSGDSATFSVSVTGALLVALSLATSRTV